MQLLGVKERTYVQKYLASMRDPVLLEVYTEADCPTCPHMQSLAEEISDAMPQVRWREGSGEAERRPAIHVTLDEPSERRFGLWFYGLPGGYEFSSLLEAILHVSTADSGLPEGLRSWLQELRVPLDLKVFVTASCPYCARMVQLAQAMAVESPHVTAQMIDAAEFPLLADSFGVQGVPLTVVNDTEKIVGAVPEHKFQQFVEGLVS